MSVASTVLSTVIKYEGSNDTIVWKYPQEDFNYGSQLIVHSSQEAIFFKDGKALDLFTEGRYTLETQNLPLLKKTFDIVTDRDNIFHSEIYFINKATFMGVKWGTDSKIRLFDPVSGLHVELGASGEFNIRVKDSRALVLKLVGTETALQQNRLLGDGNTNGCFRSLVMTHVKSFLAGTIKEKGINILEIDSQLLLLSESLKEKINGALDDYGLFMPEFFVARIVTPDEDPGFRRMKEQYAEKFLLVRQEEIRRQEAEAAQKRKEVEAATEARMKIIGAQGEAESLKLTAQAEADAYKMKAEAEAAEMRMKGYTYQQETARKVGLEAMKNGIAGSGSGGAGALGELAGLGVSLGAMGSVIGMTKDAMQPMTDAAAKMGQTVSGAISGIWKCSCGTDGNTGNFCPNCGKPRPVQEETWDCSCGKKGLTGKFCDNCGKKQGE